MVKIKSIIEKKLDDLKTVKKEGLPQGEETPIGATWSFISKALGLIIDILEELIAVQKNSKEK